MVPVRSVSGMKMHYPRAFLYLTKTKKMGTDKDGTTLINNLLIYVFSFLLKPCQAKEQTTLRISPQHDGYAQLKGGKRDEAKMTPMNNLVMDGFVCVLLRC